MIKINPLTLSNPIQRILTGIGLTLLIFFVIARDSSLLFTMFLILVASLAAYEWADTVGISRFVSRLIYSLTTALVTIFLTYVSNNQISLILASVGLVYILLCCLILLIEERGSQINLDLRGLWQVGGLGIIPINSIVLLSIFKMDPMYVAYFLMIVCSIDTFSYMGGKLLGKNLFVPIISPNKTVEGLIVGFLFGFLIFNLINVFSSLFTLDVLTANGAYLFIFLGAIIGDLNVSIMKRKSGKKNTGRLFPGHGGVLDRIDSIIFGAPCFFISLSILKTIS